MYLAHIKILTYQHKTYYSAHLFIYNIYRKIIKITCIYLFYRWTTDIVSVNGYNDIYSNAIGKIVI